jgi:hypothetical protein
LSTVEEKFGQRKFLFNFRKEKYIFFLYSFYATF